MPEWRRRTAMNSPYYSIHKHRSKSHEENGIKRATSREGLLWFDPKKGQTLPNQHLDLQLDTSQWIIGYAHTKYPYLTIPDKHSHQLLYSGTQTKCRTPFNQEFYQKKKAEFNTNLSCIYRQIIALMLLWLWDGQSIFPSSGSLTLEDYLYIVYIVFWIFWYFVIFQ